MSANAIETLRECVDGKAHGMPRHRDAVAAMEALLEAAKDVTGWDDEQQVATGAEMLTSLGLRHGRLAAAVRRGETDQ